MSTFDFKYPANKWRKHQTLLKQPTLRSFLPETAVYSRAKLETWLTRYRSVYLKPIVGGGGCGIIRINTIWVGPIRRFVVHTFHGKRTCIHLDQVLSLIKRYKLKSYLIQQGIDLFQIERRSVDFRVLMGKVNEEWVIFGMMGKVAAKGKHVTNYSRGGDAIQVGVALKQGFQLTQKQIRPIVEKMTTVSQRIAVTLNKSYPLITQLGIDLAIDLKQRIYFLEANSRPNYELFHKHEDPNLYKRIDEWISAERSLDVL
jgi:glutathione synthase/RimK-type ligase-like ATP-grasp enzyme